MPTATMTTKGQITIPVVLRAQFGLRAGDKVEFRINASGELVLRRRAGDIRALRGSARYEGPPLSLEDMDRAIAEGAASAHARPVK